MRPRPTDRGGRLARQFGLLVLLLACMVPGWLSAQEEPDPVAAAAQDYQRIEQLAQGSDGENPDRLARMIDRIIGIEAVAVRCIEDADRLLERQRRQETALLGGFLGSPESDAASPGPGDPAPPAPTTDSSLTAQHTALQDQLVEQRGRIESRKALCTLLKLNASELGRELLLRQQRAFTGKLLERKADVIEVVQRNLEKLHEWPRALGELALLVTGVQTLTPSHWAGLAGLLAVALILGHAWQRRAAPLILPEEEAIPYTTNLLLAIRGVARDHAHLLSALLALSGYALILQVDGSRTLALTNFATGMLALLLLVMLTKVLLVPPAPASPVLAVPEGTARPLARLLQVLSLLVLVGILLSELADAHQFDPDKLHLLAEIYFLVLAINVLGLLHYANSERGTGRQILRRGLPALAMATALVSMWLGYTALAQLILTGSTGTLLAIFALNLFLGLIEDLQDGLDSGRYAWQRRLRRILGLPDDDPMPGLGWLLLLLQIGLWVLFLIAVLRMWGVPAQVFAAGYRVLDEGFRIGAVDIVPNRILWAMLVLLLLITAVRWTRAQLELRWLVRTRMERGAREAVATTFGYAGIAAVVLLSLSMAGIDFSDLAIIAGALSVGIGFGLQNVVNNFISGLIMLFERPVKTGDWIQVGNTEGYVRRISIRTTIIETFDRSEVIVPNSELISNQVTNWMHNNNYGRFRVPVGVAYGSDTEKVRELLLEAAKAHLKVVRGHSNFPDPWVLFMGFGDSSLDFELRGIVYNVDYRLSVISDLNFAIDKAFRENGIEIPFPQRVVHLDKNDQSADDQDDTPHVSAT